MRARRSLLGRRLTGLGWCGRVVPAIAMGLIFAAAAMPAGAQDKKDSDANKSDGDSIGFIASKNASAKEVGLPLYPGSRRHKDDSDDSASVQLGAWGGSSGFKLVVLKMESDDAPGKVTAFYRKALSKYGKVLNCSDSATTVEKDKSPNGLDCDSDHPERGETVLKSGTKEMQHIASVKTNGNGSVYDLVYVEAKGLGNDK
ncbi:MAG: hypothetical protein ABSF40_11490 [Candidatus Acidiferrales bacterium]|jgi:hypothetical protein